jgi:hypothetical protein
MSLIATSQKELADSLGIGERTFAAWLKEGCPGEPRCYVIRDIVEWARARKWGGDDDQNLIDSLEDQALAAELVRKKIEKIARENQLADFKIEERNASLVDVSIIESRLRSDCQRLKNAIETVEKKCGDHSCDPIRSAIDSIIKDLDGGELEVFGET